MGRIGNWNKAIGWFQSNVWFGIGPSQTGAWGDASIGVTESGILKHLCELGLVGFIFYYSFMIGIFGKSIKAYRKMDNSNRCDMIFMYSIALMVFIDNITLQVSEEIMVSFIFWLGMGGLLAKSKGIEANKCLNGTVNTRRLGK